MDLDNIISIIIGVLVVIGLPLALRKRKKVGPQKREGLCQYLKEMGIKVSLAEKGDDKEKIGLSRASGQKSEGTIQLQEQNINFINIINVSSQYGTNYFLDHLVKSPNIMGGRTLKKTRLIRKKSPPLWGKVVAIEWRGDESLAQSLNLDYSVEDRLLRSNLKDFKGSILIFPEPKHGYTRIRITYLLPTSEIFEAINIIAKHVKSW